MPGAKTIFEIDWLAVYNTETRKSLGHVIIPEALNVPPSLIKVHDNDQGGVAHGKIHDKAIMLILQVMNHNPGLPNCMMLHKNMMVAWDSFPPQLTITLAGHIADDEYMAFGLSGEQVSIVIVAMMRIVLCPGQVRDDWG